MLVFALVHTVLVHETSVASALSLAHSYISLNAVSKGRSIGLIPEKPADDVTLREMLGGSTQPVIKVMSREIAVVRQEQAGEYRAIDVHALKQRHKKKEAEGEDLYNIPTYSPQAAYGYIQRAFGKDLPAGRIDRFAEAAPGRGVKIRAHRAARPVPAMRLRQLGHVEIQRAAQPDDRRPRETQARTPDRGRRGGLGLAARQLHVPAEQAEAQHGERRARRRDDEERLYCAVEQKAVGRDHDGRHQILQEAEEGRGRTRQIREGRHGAGHRLGEREAVADGDDEDRRDQGQQRRRDR